MHNSNGLNRFIYMQRKIAIWKIMRVDGVVFVFFRIFWKTINLTDVGFSLIKYVKRVRSNELIKFSVNWKIEKKMKSEILMKFTIQIYYKNLARQYFFFVFEILSVPIYNSLQTKLHYVYVSALISIQTQLK